MLRMCRFLIMALVLAGPGAVLAKPDGRTLQGAPAYAIGFCKNHFILRDPCDQSPAIGTWVRAADMTESRTHHTATLLLDGRVLVAGGTTGPVVVAGAPLASSEIYDPALDRWIAAAPMSHPRAWHSANLLPDGRVLVVGNLMPAGAGRVEVDGSAEIYDPVSNTWTAAPSPHVPREVATAVSLLSGEVLIAGGYAAEGLPTMAEIYDPATATWSNAGEMGGRYYHAATRMADGRVLVSGGVKDEDDDSSIGDTRIFDPATRRWQVVGDLQDPRSSHAMALLEDGSVVATGGYLKSFPPELEGWCSFQSLASAERFDPVTGTWTATAPLAAARMQHTMTVMDDGSLLVVAGLTSYGGCGSLSWMTRADAELADRQATSWVGGMMLPERRLGHTATHLLDGSVLVVGGTDARTPEIYRPSR